MNILVHILVNISFACICRSGNFWVIDTCQFLKVVIPTCNSPQQKNVSQILFMLQNVLQFISLMILFGAQIAPNLASRIPFMLGLLSF